MQNYLKICEEKIGFIPNVILANASNNKRLNSFVNFYNRLMIEKGHLSIIEKEMLAVVVSSINRCFYCLVSHGASLRKLTKDPILAENIVINYKTAQITKKQVLMLDFASKLTTRSHEILETDRNILRKNKFNENEILEIIEITSFFNMTNRIASGTGMIPNQEYHGMSR